MSILSIFRRRPDKQLRDAVLNLSNYVLTLKDVFPKHWRSFLNGGSGPENLTASLQSSSALFCGLSLYTGVVGGLPRFMNSLDTETGRSKKSLKTTEHPAARIWMHHSGPAWSSADMLTHMILDILWDGNFYALPVWNSSGQIAELRYIHPSRIPSGAITRASGGEQLFSRKLGGTISATTGQLIVSISSGSHSGEDNKWIQIPWEELFHMKGILQDPENFRGYGLRQFTADPIHISGESQRFIKDFITSGVRKQMFLGTDKEISAPVLAQLEKLLLKGADNDNDKPDWGDNDLGDIFRARILPSGLKPIFTGTLLSQMQFTETRAYTNEDLCRFMMVPPGLLYCFMGQGATPDSLEGMQTLWHNTGLGPFISHLGQQFRDAVLPVSSRPLYEFGFSRIHLLRTTPTSGSIAVRNMIESGILTPDTAQDIFGIRGVQNGNLYSPANIITQSHARYLEEKASLGNQVLQAQLEKLRQDIQFASEVHSAARDRGFVPPTPPSPSPVNPSSGDKKTPTEKPGDKKIANTAHAAFIAVLNGLHDHEMRVWNQKTEKQTGVELREGYAAWLREKFASTLQNSLAHWEAVPEIVNVSSLVDDWINQSVSVTEESPTPGEDLKSSHLTRVKNLMEQFHAVGSES